MLFKHTDSIFRSKCSLSLTHQIFNKFTNKYCWQSVLCVNGICEIVVYVCARAYTSAKDEYKNKARFQISFWGIWVNCEFLANHWCYAPHIICVTTTSLLFGRTFPIVWILISFFLVKIIINYTYEAVRIIRAFINIKSNLFMRFIPFLYVYICMYCDIFVCIKYYLIRMVFIALHTNAATNLQ